MAKTKKKQSSSNAKQSMVGREAAGIVLGFVAVFTFFALISYNQADPSLLSRTNRVPGNFGGRVGANIAEALIQVSGLGSFLVSALFMSFAVRVFQGTTALQLLGNSIWILLAFVAGTALLSLQFGSIKFGGSVISCGGLVGKLLADGLRHYFNLWGATLLTLCALLVATVFSTPFSAKSLFKSIKLASIALYAATITTMNAASRLFKISYIQAYPLPFLQHLLLFLIRLLAFLFCCH